MKSALLVLVVVGAVAAYPQKGQDTTVTRSEFENLGETFKWVSELSDGNRHEQSGQLKQIGSESGIAITGSYSFTAPDGQVYEVQYVADENGFQPTGAHLPSNAQGAGGATPARASRPAPRRQG